MRLAKYNKIISILIVILIFICLIYKYVTGYYKFGGTYGVGSPFGNGNTDRPGNIYAETGMIRLNTDSLSVEVFNGAAWSSVVGNAGGITNIQATDIALGIVLSLG